MQCPQCDLENPRAARFCHGCGAQFGQTCGSCGTRNLAGSRFCIECGKALDAADLPRPLLEDERKQVTILFADVKGSMELLSGRDPEEARRILDPVLERMMGAVQEYEGTVNQVLGDGIMALFGAPRAQEDHAVRACLAALSMQESIRRHAEEQQQSLKVRIGLNSDQVVVRSIGSDLRSDYTAVGIGTHLAARMEQLARPGAILATAATMRLVEGFVTTKPLGRAEIKGLGSPVEVFEVTGPGRMRARMQMGASRVLTQFSGRESELAELRKALQDALDGSGRMVAVAGEAGVGKSRLLWEFIRLRELDGWQIFQARGYAYTLHATYRPITSLLRSYFGLVEDDAAETLTAAVDAQLESMGLAQLRSPVLALLDLPVEALEWQSLDPAQRRRRTIDAFRVLLRLRSTRVPVCLVIEDMQWVDAETEAILDNLTQEFPNGRLLVLFSARPEHRSRWEGKEFYRKVAIDPLPPSDAEALLRELVGATPESEGLRRQLLERTGGNPFFIEESARHLRETGVLGAMGSGGGAASPGRIEIPPTVYAVLAARIDRLPVALKHVLQAAAAIGAEVPVAVLQEVAGLSAESAGDALARLVEANLLTLGGSPAKSEFRFKHSLTLEVAYSSLVRERRHALDAAIVKSLETLYGERLEPIVEQLAHHSTRGNLWPKSAAYSSAAGRKAFNRSAHRIAVTHFENALAALRQMPASGEPAQAGIDLRLDLRNALLPLGEFERAFNYLREAEALAAGTGDKRRQGLAASHLTVHFFLKGDYAQTISSGQRTLSLGAEVSEVGIQAVANLCLGQAHHSLGSYREAIGFLTTAVDLLHGPLARERFGMTGLPSVAAHTWLAWCCSELGEFDEGLRRSDAGLHIAASVAEPWSLASATFAQGLLRVRMGDCAGAIPQLQGGLEKCRAYDIRTWIPPLASALGHALVLSGNRERGLPLLEEAVAQAVAMKMVFRHSLRLAWLGEGLLLAGELDRAEKTANESVELARAHRERGHEAYALRVLGLVQQALGEKSAAEADRHLSEALSLAESLGMRPLQAACKGALEMRR